ncbi:uncharacterized protein LOC126252382 [Schistocerca nitens]|uniref:uncharacterized protein LOC126252382 n=1 Tax=Schistocerca nitens TaxID=7011 RepID=UPI0021195B5A|nr:uncharacterized protein LOC126252382 [Schistocerca nitens]
MVGHVARFCTLPPRCVKCAGEHASLDCTRQRRHGPPKCIGCGGEHVASYRDCSSFQRAAARSRGHRPGSIKRPAPVRPGVSFAAAATSGSSPQASIPATKPATVATRDTARLPARHSEQQWGEDQGNTTTPNRDDRLTSWQARLNTHELQLYHPRRPIPAWTK